MNTTLSRAALWLLPAFAICAPAHAGIVSGQVTDSGGTGLVGVTLNFSGSGNPTATTGAGGFFSLFVNDGTYDIDVLPPTGAYAPQELLGVRLVGTVNLPAIKLANGYALSGTARTQGGAAVAGGNIDVVDASTGQTLFTPKDGIGATGTFSVVVPSGTFHVQVKPPSGTLLVAQEVRNVVVAAAPRSVGVVTLPPGVLVTGTMVDDTTGTGIANADLDADDAITGLRMVTPGDNTNSLGQFSLVLPNGLFHLSFDPPAGTNWLGRQRFNIQVNGPTNTGVTRIRRGLVLSGTALGPGGTPVAGADIDVDDVPGGLRVYTPHDNTDTAGRFSVVVPAGTYTVSVQPAVSTGLVGARTAAMVVTGTTTVPTFNLAAGSLLSGTLTAFAGGGEYDTNIDVLDPVSGNELVLSGDRTAGNGTWSVIVPDGTWDVVFKTRKASLSRVATVPVTVAGPTTLNHQLSMVPVAVYLGTTGIPTVAQGGPVLTTLAFFNPAAQAVPTNFSMTIIDPDGTKIPLLPPLPFTMPALAIGVGIGVPIGIPPVNPALLGRRFHLEVRFDDPATGAELDRDEFPFYIQ